MSDDTEKAINNPSISSGVMLLLGALMLETGVTKFTMDADTFPIDVLKAMQLERKGNKLTVRIITEGEE